MGDWGVSFGLRRSEMVERPAWQDKNCEAIHGNDLALFFRVPYA